MMVQPLQVSGEETRGGFPRALKTVVLIADAADAKGGASIAMLRSATVLADAGLQVRIFAATGPYAGPMRREITACILEDGLDLIQANLLTRATKSLWNQEAADVFGRFIDDLDPEETMIHVHSFHVNLTASVLKRAIDRGFSLVSTSHDYSLACPYSGFYHYRKEKPCGKRALSVSCAATLCTAGASAPGKAWHVGKALIQRSHVPRGISQFAFVSDFSRQKLMGYLPSNAKTRVIPNPLDFADEGPREMPPDAPFLWVGRMTSEKGPDVFARAASSLSCEAVFAGSGPEESSLKRICPTGQFLGWKNGAEIRELMKVSRGLVFTSRWFEGQPLTVQEAQSLGLPVICSDVCAAAESIHDGENGFLFKSGDSSDLAKKMWALQDDTLAVQQGRKAYELFWQNPPTPQKHLDLTLEMYREVLESRTR